MVPPASEHLRVLVFGGLARHKGVDLLLFAVAQRPGIPMDITLAGEAQDAAYGRDLEGLTAQIGHKQYVTWRRGFVPETDIAMYFGSNDVVAPPCRYIDHSDVMFTAVRFGCPVIATDVGAFHGSVAELAGMIVDDARESALAAGPRQLLDRRQSLDRQQSHDYAQSLDWTYCIRPLFVAYTEADS
jgi:glycosyltransferase involved in cell wall biosynthesis